MIDNSISNKSPTMCVLPFIHGATLTDGSMPLCCVAEGVSKVNLNKGTISDYWNSPYVRDVRQKMIKGEQVSACRRCYEEEKSGYRSHRVIENKAWVEKVGQQKLDEIIHSVKDDGTLERGLVSLDLRLGNTCNLQCIMCQPRESSKWNSAVQGLRHSLKNKELDKEWAYKADIKSANYEWYKNTSFWANLKEYLPDLREIIVGGGEPMLIRPHLDFIKACAESGEAHHIHLRYHTNMTVFPEEMIPYWEKFECVEFFSSIDGMEDVGNYVRYPAKWDLVEKNLRRLDQLADNIWMRLLYSVNALNIHHIPDFLRWVRAQNFRKQSQFKGIQSFVHPGLVHWPDYLNVKVLPRDYKLWVTDMMSSLRNDFSNEDFDKYEGVVHFMNSQDHSHKLPLLKDYVQALDRTRQTDFYAVFPELSESLLSQEVHL